MKTITLKHTTLLGVLLLFCLLCKGIPAGAKPAAWPAQGLQGIKSGKISSAIPAIALNNSSVQTQATATAGEPPVIQFILEDNGTSDVGQSVRATIKAYAPNGGRITLRIDSAEAYGNNTAKNLAGASFSPTLPQQASDTAVVTMSWVPKREHLGFIAFHFSAADQQGLQSSEELLYLVDMPLVIRPTPAIEVGVNQAFELIIPVEDADWHELYEAEPNGKMPAWLSVEVISLDENSAPNAIRLWGTPKAADRGTHTFKLDVRAIFGKETTITIQLRVVNGRNQGWFQDRDGDGFGHNLCILTACRQPAGYVSKGGDCNDNDARIYPGATELADGIDNNCNGQVDEGGNCYASRVVSFRQGFRPDGKTIGSTRSNAQLALGAPQETNKFNFVSLGFGGELVLELGDHVYDDGSEAPDLMVVETTWGWAKRPCYDGKGAGNPETMVMEVSANGSDWAAIPNTFCRNAKVDLSPVVGGKGKLPYVRYIKITDTSNPADFHPSANGYDVDGIITCAALFDNIQANASLAAAGGFNPDFFNEAPDDEDSLQQLNAYPNPVRDFLTIQTGTFESANYVVKLYNLQGALIYQGSYRADPASGNLKIDVHMLNQGMYFLRLEAEDGLQHELKIIKE